MWLTANGLLVSFLTPSMSRLTLAGVRKSDPMPPSPPLFDTAAASSADVQVPIGARMIGTSMPNKSHRVVLSMCAISKWRRWPGRKRDDFSLYVIPLQSDHAPGARRPSPGFAPTCHAREAKTRRVQLRVRFRIMKVSQLYSATCHQRYSSLRNVTIESQTLL